MKDERISDRTREQLDRLPPEKRERALEKIARTQTPEYRAREAADREALDTEWRETGQIAAVKVALSPAELEAIRKFFVSLRHVRESRGLSLSDLAERTGIDKSALSRLENGQQGNPTLATVARYARAVGKRLTWSLEDAPV